MRYGDLKKQVAEMVVAHLEPFQQRYREITADPGYLAGVLREGAERVAPIANDTVALVKERMGLYIVARPRPDARAPTCASSADNRNFRLLWLAQIVSELGDWFYALAVYNLLLDLTGNKAQAVGLAVVLQVLPHTLVAPTAGRAQRPHQPQAHHDRRRRRALLHRARACCWCARPRWSGWSIRCCFSRPSARPSSSRRTAP